MDGLVGHDLANDVTEDRMAGDPQDRHRSGLPGTAMALLTREAGRVPLLAVSVGLRAWEQSRPVRRLAVRRGSEVLQIVAHTPLGRFLPQPLHDDDADAEAEQIATAARRAGTEAAERASRRAAEPPPPPTPATSAPPTLVAPPVAAPATPKAEKELPIQDFDNISIGSLRARLRNLTVDDLETLRAWEQAHANRPQVVTLLNNRIAKVSAS
jgi:hypothetical protein